MVKDGKDPRQAKISIEFHTSTIKWKIQVWKERCIAHFPSSLHIKLLQKKYLQDKFNPLNDFFFTIDL